MGQTGLRCLDDDTGAECRRTVSIAEKQADLYRLDGADELAIRELLTRPSPVALLVRVIKIVWDATSNRAFGLRGGRMTGDMPMNPGEGSVAALPT